MVVVVLLGCIVYVFLLLLTCGIVRVLVCDIMTRYPAKIDGPAGPIEMPFGMWGGAQVTMY